MGFSQDLCFQWEMLQACPCIFILSVLIPYEHIYFKHVDLFVLIVFDGANLNKIPPAP